MQAVMEEVSGGRMHYMFNRVGGLKEDMPAGWLDRVGAAVGAVRGAAARRSRTWSSATRSSGPAPGASGCCPAELVDAYGVSGPIARASGVDFDLRRDEPYLAYDELLADGVLQVLTRTEGDCYARFGMLLDQVQGVARPRRGLHRPAALPGPPAR